LRFLCLPYTAPTEIYSLSLHDALPIFALELLEPDYLPFDYNDLTKGIQQGIERDAWRRVRAYHLYKQHPGDMQGYWLDSTNTKRDRKSTRLNSSHVKISYAVFCLKKKR